MVLKVSPCYIYNIYNSTRSDWLWAPYFLNYFESELFYRYGPFIKHVLLLRHEKNVIYSKMVNNPFKEELEFKNKHAQNLKGLLTNFEYITFFSCLNRRNIFYERSTSIKQLWLEIFEKIGCSIISSQSGIIQMDLS